MPPKVKAFVPTGGDAEGREETMVSGNTSSQGTLWSDTTGPRHGH